MNLPQLVEALQEASNTVPDVSEEAAALQRSIENFTQRLPAVATDVNRKTARVQEPFDTLATRSRQDSERIEQRLDAMRAALLRVEDRLQLPRPIQYDAWLKATGELPDHISRMRGDYEAAVGRAASDGDQALQALRQALPQLVTALSSIRQEAVDARARMQQQDAELQRLLHEVQDSWTRHLETSQQTIGSVSDKLRDELESLGQQAIRHLEQHAARLDDEVDDTLRRPAHAIVEQLAARLDSLSDGLERSTDGLRPLAEAAAPAVDRLRPGVQGVEQDHKLLEAVVEGVS